MQGEWEIISLSRPDCCRITTENGLFFCNAEGAHRCPLCWEGCKTFLLSKSASRASELIPTPIQTSLSVLSDLLYQISQHLRLQSFSSRGNCSLLCRPTWETKMINITPYSHTRVLWEFLHIFLLILKMCCSYLKQNIKRWLKFCCSYWQQITLKPLNTVYCIWMY